MRRRYVPDEYEELYLEYCKHCLKKKRKRPTHKEFGIRVIKILKKNQNNLLYDEVIKF